MTRRYLSLPIITIRFYLIRYPRTANPTLTVMEQNAWLTPFVRPELPDLARCKNADNTIPRVCAKLVESLNRVDNIISLGACACLATRFNCRTFPIDGYEVLCPSGTLRSSACSCLC